jgi:hypothetical protein
MDDLFRNIEICVPEKRFRSWEHFMQETPEYSIGLEVVEDTPGHRGHWVHFDHHDGVIREVTMSAAMQAYIAVRQGRLMERWLRKRRPVKVYVWNADQDVCLSAFVLEYHEMLERAEGTPLLRWIVQYNNKIDVCGGLYPVNLAELVRNHFTWVFEPYRQQRRQGKMQGDEALIRAPSGGLRPPAGPHSDPRRHRAHHRRARDPPQLALQLRHRRRKGRPGLPPRAGRPGSHQPDQPGLPAGQRPLHLQHHPRLALR